MKYWKIKLLIQEEQQQSSVRDSSFDNNEMIQPCILEQSENNSIPKTKLPGRNLTSLNELKITVMTLTPMPQHSTGQNTSCQGVE